MVGGEDSALVVPETAIKVGGVAKLTAVAGPVSQPTSGLQADGMVRAENTGRCHDYRSIRVAHEFRPMICAFVGGGVVQVPDGESQVEVMRRVNDVEKCSAERCRGRTGLVVLADVVRREDPRGDTPIAGAALSEVDGRRG